ncbi:malectin domain-containing carbohydrate-binding protein [Salinigranum salinum]|uniref:malectin domain-containing carbohydrate-binding protein n=1 Tax=Salinigranum salinum TaxID=1364937 RepID=UPI001F03BC18|nr:malectin domain-containing carbohydrate-binding protein [Salinigranum salinum]
MGSIRDDITRGAAVVFVLLVCTSGFAGAVQPTDVSPELASGGTDPPTSTADSYEIPNVSPSGEAHEQQSGSPANPGNSPNGNDEDDPRDPTSGENVNKGEDGPNTGEVTRITSCQVIDEPGKYLLTRNLFSTEEGPCIHITSSNVELNGARYRIADATGAAGSSQVGILVGQQGLDAETITDVTIKNAIVSGWTTGIRFVNTEQSRAQNNYVTGNGNGITLFGERTTDVTLRGNTLTGNAQALEVQESSGNQLVDNHASNNLEGVRLSNASDNAIQKNDLLENHRFGVLLRRNSNGNRIAENRIGNNGRADQATENAPETPGNGPPDDPGSGPPGNSGDGSTGNSGNANTKTNPQLPGVAFDTRTDGDRQYKIKLSADSTGNEILRNTLTTAGPSGSADPGSQISADGGEGTNAITGNEIRPQTSTDDPLPSFNSTGLEGVDINNPTSLQFGPDGRLYVATQAGTIYAYEIQRNSADSYEVTSTETINEIKNLPNHDDDGSLNTNVNERLVTGMLVTGTAENPTIYVASSDPRIGGGSGGEDLPLDTNSGVLSRLEWDGSSWNHTQLARGLPRSEENHHANGMQLDEANNTLYISIGGNTNKGARSNNFAFLTEYAYSAAVVSVDLDQINAMSRKDAADTDADYLYDIPTLDPDNPDRVDNGPFGGLEGENMAILTENGPIQIYAPGFRNAYDLVLTEDDQLYTVDNGGNSGWGGPPINEGPNGECTNEINEDDSFSEKDYLHYISGEGYYGGHPNPVRGNPDATNYSAAVPSANPVECDYRAPGNNPDTLTGFSSSTNGIDEYTASSFENALQGDLLTASFAGDIWRVQLNETGTGVDSTTSLASSFGSTPLDVTAQNDTEQFGGTVWAATYGSDDITVFEPNENNACTGADRYNLDGDGDGYSNADEIDNGADPCSSASVPPDNDGDGLSDLNDYDDDDDGQSDIVDPFAVDADNGQSLPVSYQFQSGEVDGTILDLGFTGLMTNGQDDYRTLYNFSKLTPGGAAEVLSVDNVTEGSAYETLNSQEYAFQFGVYPENEPFTAHTTITSGFTGATVADNQSQGVYIGTGDQANYIELTATAKGGDGGIRLGKEQDDSFSTVAEPTVPEVTETGSKIDLYLEVDPLAGTVTGYYAIDGGTRQLVGSTSLPSEWTGQPDRGVAVGVIGTSRGPASSFNGTWTQIEATQPASTQSADIAIKPNSGINSSTYGQNSFQITNTGDEKIAAVTFNLSSSHFPDMVFDPNGTAGDQAFRDFVVGSEGGTGQSDYSFQRPHDGDPDDGYDTLRVEFTDFDPGETFKFGSDVDPSSIKGVSAPGPEESGSVSGLELVGSTITVEYEDGTTQVTKPYSDGSDGGSQAVAKTALANTPELGVSGVDLQQTTLSPDHTAATVGDASQTMTVTGPPGKTVRLLRVEAGLFTDGVPDGGYDLEAFEANSATAVEETTGTIGSDGTTTMDVTLTRSSDTVDLNYLVAVVEDGDGDTGRVSNVVVLEYDADGLNDAPAASFSSSPTSPDPGETITFDASGSSDSDGSISSYAWDFDGDGTTDATTAQASTSYATAGEKTVTLTVTDDDGSIDSTSRTIVVSDSTGYTTTTIDTCQVIDSPGRYTLSADITDSSATPCIQITSSDVILDGAGHTIDGDTTVSGSDHKAVYVGQTGLTPSTITNVTVENVVATDWNTGIYLERVTDGTVQDSTATNNLIGVHLAGTDGNQDHAVIDTTATQNDRGILLENTQSSTVQGGNASDNRIGVRLTDADDNTVSDLQTASNTDAQYSLVSAGSTNVAENITVGDTTVDLTGANIALDTVASPPADPSGQQNIGKYVEVVSTGPDPSVDIQTYYADADVSDIDESTLDMWRYDGSWSLVSGTNQVDETTNYVSASSTQVGVFAPLADSNAEVVYRVNAGGTSIASSDGGPDWAADTSSSPSSYSNPGASDSTTYSTSDTISTTSSVSSSTPTEVFQTERYDPPSGEEMQWEFPVESGSTYEVRLYLAELYFTADGEREFDATAENNLVLDGYDIHADVGHDTGTVKTFTVTPDSTLDLDFAHIANNPKVAAIEVVRLDGTDNTAPSIDPIADQTVTEGSSTTVDVTASDADGDSLSLSLGQAPSFVSLTDNGDGTGTIDIAPQSGDAGTYTVDVVADDGTTTTTESFTLSVGDGSAEVVYRVNAGGTSIASSDGGPDWAADTSSSPSSYSNPGASDSTTYSTSDTISTTSSVSSSTPTEVFQTERYDPPSGEEMQWEFPVESGSTYEVRLYLAELYFTADGEREFDATAENDLVLDSYDIHADVGHDTGTVKTFSVTPDSTLDLDFAHVANNPKVAAIEVVRLDGATSNAAPSASFTYSPSDPTVDETITFDASGSSDSDGSISSYAWDFDGDGTTDATTAEASFSYSSSGDKTVTLTVTDDAGATDTTTQTITVGDSTGNTAPSIDPIADQTVTEGSSTTVDVTASDADGDSLSLSLGQAPSFVSLTETGDGTGTVSIDPGTGDAGTYTVDVVADDGTTTTTESFNLTVDDSTDNTAPSIDPIADQTVTEGSSTTVDVTASDADGDSLSLSLGQAPSFVSLTDNGDGTGTIDIAPQSGDAGTYTVDVVADDGTTTTTESFTLTVGDGSAEVVYRVNAGGTSIASSDGGPDWAADTSSSPSSYSNPGASDSTTYSTSDTISTTSSVSSSTPTEVFQTERYDPPSGEEMQWEFPVESGSTYEVRLYLAELYFTADGEREFDATAENNLVLDGYDIHADVGHDTGTVKTFSVTPDSTLDLDFAHIANNPKVAAIEIVRLDGATSNTAPSASFTYSPSDPTVDETITFDASGSSDSDGSISSYAWDFDGDGTTDATTAQASFSYSSSGDKTVTLTVTDDAGATDTTTQTITVGDSTGNTAPSIDPIADQTVTEGSSTTVDVTASDADGDSLSLSLGQAPSFVSLTDNGDGTGTIDIAPQSGDAGTYTVDVVADDGTTTTTESFTLTVDDSTATSDAIYRVNAGGSQISDSDGGGDWIADTSSDPASETNAGNADSQTFSTSDTIATTSVVPSTTPTEVFTTGRSDPSSGAEMKWDIPDVVGGETYEVRLYFAETEYTSDGQRVFDVSIEGTTVLDNYDIHADVGHDTGTVKTFTVESSTELDIDFGRETGDPAVVAIEIVPADST